MKRLISILLVLSLACAGCLAETADPVPQFSGMNDPALLPYIEDTVYQELVGTLDGDHYVVESVTAVYISQEYIDELAYNSQSNIFFGYTLPELDAQFEGTRYVFTLGDNYETTVMEFQAYDDSYDRMIRNVAIGGGVILVCVVVSVVSYGAGAPAVYAFFLGCAKEGAKAAVIGGITSGVPTAVITGVTTGDMDAALKSGLLDGSDGFKWGAIGGALKGGSSNYFDQINKTKPLPVKHIDKLL